jgi:hypothetical protein
MAKSLMRVKVLRAQWSSAMAGIAVYFAFLLMTAIWVLGWAGVSVLAGAFFDLPVQTTSILGAVLGPIGFLVTILVGVVQRKEAPMVSSNAVTSSHRHLSDPFA